MRFQDKKFAEDPVKAKARRRYVVGLREATKYMKVSNIQKRIIDRPVGRVEGVIVGSLCPKRSHPNFYNIFVVCF